MKRLIFVELRVWPWGVDLLDFHESLQLWQSIDIMYLSYESSYENIIRNEEKTAIKKSRAR